MSLVKEKEEKRCQCNFIILLVLNKGAPICQRIRCYLPLSKHTVSGPIVPVNSLGRPCAAP
ncbi:hypothetical protein T4D_6610 [Trichinella pseudospiralis]|uniref:Uncharacterized protein n=1 Tax=Trichinella pseudospiralis TaxID=6337 RepID=A0A0V1G3I6_TRIPS|nr:hypothetical protein T4D_6610 [Trichinella pseudospiralis]